MPHHTKATLLRIALIILINCKLEVRVDINLVLHASHHALVNDHPGRFAEAQHPIRVDERRHRVLGGMFEVPPSSKDTPVLLQDARDLGKVRFESLPAVSWQCLV